MEVQSVFERISKTIHHYLLVLMLAAYGLAAILPGLGAAARQIKVVHIGLFGDNVAVSLPMLLLAGLLLNAGLGTAALELTKVLRRPQVVLAGFVANLAVPLVVVFLLSQLLRFWHNADEVQTLLVGLSFVAAMPVAGSSMVWSQNSEGNLALSLGLVVLSTLLSPVTTPFAFGFVKLLAKGSYAETLGQLSDSNTGAFLTICVVLPSVAGMFARSLLGQERLTRLKPLLKLVNSSALLFLCYANASASLPGLIADPDWDYLAIVLVIVMVLCLAAFAAGWLLARLLRVDEAQQWSLIFALGMNNNGTGMVMASTALTAMPGALLPVLAYNLFQHLVAGGISASRRLLPSAEVSGNLDVLSE